MLLSGRDLPWLSGESKLLIGQADITLTHASLQGTYFVQFYFTFGNVGKLTFKLSSVVARICFCIFNLFCCGTVSFFPHIGSGPWLSLLFQDGLESTAGGVLIGR